MIAPCPFSRSCSKRPNRQNWGHTFSHGTCWEEKTERILRSRLLKAEPCDCPRACRTTAQVCAKRKDSNQKTRASTRLECSATSATAGCCRRVLLEIHLY